MKGSALQRARRLPRAPLDVVTLPVLGVLAALFAPLLILVLGFLVQLKLGRSQDLPPQNWAVAFWMGEHPLGLPWFSNADLCLMALLGLGLGLALLEALALLLYLRAAERSAVDVTTRLKESIHAQALRIGAGDLLGGPRWRPEELFTDRVEVVRRALAAWWRAVPHAVLEVALLVVLAASIDFWVTLLIVLLAGCVWRVRIDLDRWSQNRARKAEEQARERHELLLEDLHLAPLAAGYALDRTLAEPFARGLRQYQNAAWRARSGQYLVGPLFLWAILLAGVCLAFVISFSAGMKEKPLPGLVTLMTAMCCAYFPSARLYRLRTVLREGEEAAAEVFQYLDRAPAVNESADARPHERLTAGIELDRVTIADRNGHKLLAGVTMTIEAGMRVGLVASDSQTPLAIAGLMVRFYDPAAGRILFDGKDIRHGTLDSLRGQTALVGGRSLLFTGTVSDNITCGVTGYTTPQITDAAKLACAYEFIQGLPQGFSTIIGEHGVRLDRSEALRVALTRALLREPSLLVVQEPPDPPGEPLANPIDEALLSVAKGRTLITIPTRLNTLRTLDRIYLFHEGALHAQGSHADLLQTSDLYRHLNYLGFNPYRGAAK